MSLSSLDPFKVTEVKRRGLKELSKSLTKHQRGTIKSKRLGDEHKAKRHKKASELVMQRMSEYQRKGN